MGYDHFFFARPADGSPPQLETLGEDLGPQADASARWKLVDAVPGIAPVLVIAAGIVALALPVLTHASSM